MLKVNNTSLTTLEQRRIRGDMIEVFKIVHGYDNVDRSTWFQMAADRGTYPTRLATTLASPTLANPDPQPSPTLNIVKPKAVKNLDLRRNFFSHRVFDTWNKIPISFLMVVAADPITR